ncbi:MAG: family N-acetyltransferase [Thermomicrobiales bacterium]|nr:family N-acetyltransferase [Thermomicrobiales bacterium]
MTETLPTHEVTVRPANAADVAEITRIYNEGIRDRLATLETEERTPWERLAWLEARDERHPVLVAERAGAVAGWGSLNVFNPRPAYAHVATSWCWPRSRRTRPGCAFTRASASARSASTASRVSSTAPGWTW